ncbi:M50 family metallopeptidase [Mycolicibacterium sp. XJ1819]
MTATLDHAGPAQAVMRRADGVVLIGEMAGSGYRVPPSLVRRADGQTIQLSPLLYHVLAAVDGQRNTAEVADTVRESTERPVSEDNVRQLIDTKLRPLGLMARPDGTEPEVTKRNPLLALRFRYAITDPDQTRRLTDPFRVLFRAWLAIPMLVAFAAVCWWVFFRKGLAAAAYDAFERPGLLILVFAVTVVSAGFHEFGHAAAARYGGATPGVMGFGLYLLWPAFYTDVTDSYRLGRAGRLRTDLGGLYFNAVVAVAITALWWGLRYDALLLVVATQIIQMVRQLTPLVRFDGYHVLADLTGVPDLYGRIKPILLGMLPWRWHDAEVRALKPWARIVVTVWVVLVVPLLIGMLALAVVTLPRLIGTAWASLTRQQDVLVTAWADGDLVQATARVLAMIAIVIPTGAVIYLLIRVVRSGTSALWRGTAGRPARRALAVVFGAAVLGAVGYAWLDSDNYRPIQAAERGTLSDIVFALGVERMATPRTVSTEAQPVAADRSLAAGQQGVMRALWDTGTPPPRVTAPQLAVILVPKTPPATLANGGFVPASAAPADQGWVFPVDKPLAPEPGDNQALAVNTVDGTVEYEAAFALVWATDEHYALNVNEAHAYASCDGCAAVAVAYQVVFVIDNDDANDNVAIPQNLAGALNYDCVNCLTYAIARQLFVTLDEPLSDGAIAELDTIWAEIQRYERKIEAGKVPVDTIVAQLNAYTERIKAVVEADQPGTFPTTTAPPTSAPSTPTGTPSATTPPPSSPSAEPTMMAEPTAEATEDAGAQITAADTTDAPTPTDEPTATDEPSATSDPVVDNTTSTGTSTDATGSEDSGDSASSADSSASP